jgi:hypothetical protein
MRQRWFDSRLDEPTLVAHGAFPALGRAAWLRLPTGTERAAGEHGGRDDEYCGGGGERGPHEHGLRWPPAEWSWPEPDDARAASGDGGAGRGPGAPYPAANLNWLLDDPTEISIQAQEPSLSDPDGAPSGFGGRFAAEWSPPGTSSRSSRSMPLLSERARRVKKGGGVMARRALLERSDQLTADDEALQLRQPRSARPDQVMPHWRGAGGRWLVWVARAIAWAALLLIGYRGVLAIIQGPAPSPARSDNAASGSRVISGGTQFPVTEAEAYALEFGHAYLNFSPATAAARSASLASFLPPGYDRSLGWNGAGTQRMLDEQVASVSVTGKHTAVVTLLALLSHGKMLELGVPIYAANGGMSVSGEPALLPGPAKAAPPVATPPTSDQATEAALQGQLPAFFQAYASGDQATLARFSARGAHIRGLGGDVSLAAVDSVHVPAGGSSRQVVVTVTWDLASAAPAKNPAKKPAKKVATVSAAPAAFEMTYQLTIVRQGGSWDIRSIGASTETLASGPP